MFERVGNVISVPEKNGKHFEKYKIIRMELFKKAEARINGGRSFIVCTKSN